MVSATLPGNRSLNTPNPPRSKEFGAELPRDAGSGLKNSDRRGHKQIPEAGLDRGVQRLIDVVGDGGERAIEAGNLVMRV